MRWSVVLGVLLFAFCLSAHAATGKIAKVLPHWLDLQGRHTLHPSLYERDAYQAHLRKHPAECSALRFDVRWKADKTGSIPITLRIEMRGSREPKPFIVESKLDRRPWYKRWTSLKLEGEDFKKAGEITAWRASLWQGDQLLAEQKSFLW